MVMTNAQFYRLAEKLSPFLKVLSSDRHERDPDGYITKKDLEEISSVCRSSGRHKDANTINSVLKMHTTGMLRRILSNRMNWEDHTAEVSYMHSIKSIPFNINERVIIKETGQQGTIADYNVQSGKYIVVTDPFRVKDLEPGELLSGK